MSMGTGGLILSDSLWKSLHIIKIIETIKTIGTCQARGTTVLNLQNTYFLPQVFILVF